MGYTAFFPCPFIDCILSLHFPQPSLVFTIRHLGALKGTFQHEHENEQHEHCRRMGGLFIFTYPLQWHLP